MGNCFNIDKDKDKEKDKKKSNREEDYVINEKSVEYSRFIIIHAQK